MLLPLALGVTMAVEITVFVFVGRRVGFGVALLLVLVGSLVGAGLTRREGARAWRGFHEAAQAGRPPGGQIADGLVGLAAGLLLMVPGLVTSVVGGLLAVPPGRTLARSWAQAAAERRISSAAAGDLFGPRRVRVYRGGPSASPPGGGSASPGPVIEGEVVDPGGR